MKVAEAIARELRQRGITTVFGLMGSDTIKLTAALSAHGLRYLSSRHEAGAVGMADGYSRVSGDVGVALVSRGPGFTNSLTALKTASNARSRVLVLVGDTPESDDAKVGEAASRQPKHIAQQGILKQAGIASVRIRSFKTAIADLAATLERARQGATVVANLPTNVLDGEPGEDVAQVELPPVVLPTRPEPEQIRFVADLLEEKRRPVILAGRGAMHAGHELERLGELCGAVLATTLLGRGLFAGQAFHVGISGDLGSSMALELLRNSDVVLAFGASLNDLTTYKGTVFGKAHIVQFDSDPSALGRWIVPDVCVVSDARLGAAALVEELERRSYRATGYRSAEVAERIGAYRLEDSFRDQSEGAAADPRSLLLALDEVLPTERALIVDPGHHLAFSAVYLSAPAAATYFCAVDYGSVGAGMGVALGVAVARSDRLTVLEIGDGGLMMTLGELDTAVRYGLPVVILVINDAAYGAELHFMRLDGLPDATARFTDVPFERVARALGADGATVRSAADVRALKGRFANLQRPFVIDCKVTTEVRADYIASWNHLVSPRPAEPVAR